jgi:hypothetical protein
VKKHIEEAEALEPVGKTLDELWQQFEVLNDDDRAKLKAGIREEKRRIDDCLATLRRQTAPPPQLAESLISLLAPKKSADAQLGDLQEIFQENVKRFGLERARRMYCIRISREVGPLLLQKLMRWLERFGIIALLIDYGRTKLGF